MEADTPLLWLGQGADAWWQCLSRWQGNYRRLRISGSPCRTIAGTKPRPLVQV